MPQRAHLYHDLSPPKELLHLVRYMRILALSAGLHGPPILVLLELQVVQGSVDAADLSVGPTLHSMTTAQPFQSRHGDAHGLVDKSNFRSDKN